MIVYTLALNVLCKITNEYDLYKFIFVKSLKEKVIKWMAPTWTLLFLNPDVSELKPSLLCSLLPAANTRPFTVIRNVPSLPQTTCLNRCFPGVATCTGKKSILSHSVFFKLMRKHILTLIFKMPTFSPFVEWKNHLLSQVLSDLKKNEIWYENQMEVQIFLYFTKEIFGTVKLVRFHLIIFYYM